MRADPGRVGRESGGVSVGGTGTSGDSVLGSGVPAAGGQTCRDGDGRGTGGQRGWVVVCGQGLQLLRVMTSS